MRFCAIIFGRGLGAAALSGHPLSLGLQSDNKTSSTNRLYN